MSRLLTLGLLASLLLAACTGGGIQPLPTEQPATPVPASPRELPPIETVAPTQVVTPTDAATPTDAVPPTEAPVPTESPTPTEAPADTARLIAASVKIQALAQGAAGLVPVHTGSGTIISPDGLILTNAHVAAPDAPGLAVQYGDLSGAEPLAEIHILMTDREDESPVARYKAEVVAVDGYLDIAVVRIVSTIDDQPVANLDLPWVQLGDSDALRIRDQIIVVGFPGIGGDTVSASDGEVSGFLEDPKIGARGWIKTSAIVHSGNSGGLAADALGRLVGVPTRAPDSKDPTDIGGFELLRPVNLALPVIEAAQRGENYLFSRYVEAGTGQEQFQSIGWLREGNAGCSPSDIVTSYPSGVGTIEAAFDWSGFTAGEDFAYAWLGQPEGTSDVRLLWREGGVWQAAASGQCFAFELSMRNTFPDGTYGFVIGAGPQLRIVGDAEVRVGGTEGPADGILLGGRIIDANSGRGIVEAGVIVFVPGTDVDAWLNDPDRDRTPIAASATTAEDGTFTLNARLAPSTEYPVLIGARGYEQWTGILTTGTVDGSLGEVALYPAP